MKLIEFVKFESESKSWEEAETVCKNYGEHVHLTSVMNKLEEDILVVLSHPEDFWVGLKKEEVTSIKKFLITS